jgi:serine/threonine protein kinase
LHLFQGYLHRDGKASNWVMDSRDASRPLLIDFGLAQRIADGMGCAEGFTSSHAPPEYLLAMERHGQWSWRRQRRGAPAGEPLPCGGVLELLRVTLGTATDIYLLGATLWEVRTHAHAPGAHGAHPTLGELRSCIAALRGSRLREAGARLQGHAEERMSSHASG